MYLGGYSDDEHESGSDIVIESEEDEAEEDVRPILFIYLFVCFFIHLFIHNMSRLRRNL